MITEGYIFFDKDWKIKMEVETSVQPEERTIKVKGIFKDNPHFEWCAVIYESDLPSYMAIHRTPIWITNGGESIHDLTWIGKDDKCFNSK